MQKISRLGFLASGRGSNMQAIINACESGVINASACVVISNNPGSRALEIGKKHGLDFFCVNKRKHSDVDTAILNILKEAKIDLVVLAGYMKRVGESVIQQYPSRILNIHPSLLPLHGGEGMYGMNVHKAVIAAGDKQTGATIHLVTGDYDTGPIVSQVIVPVSENDTYESLSEKVLEKEHELYVSTIAGIVKNTIILNI